MVLLTLCPGDVFGYGVHQVLPEEVLVCCQVEASVDRGLTVITYYVEEPLYFMVFTIWDHTVYGSVLLHR